MKKIVLLILITTLTTNNFAQDEGLKLFRLNDMVKLVGMDIDDALTYLGNFNYNLVKKDINKDQINYLLFELDFYELDAFIRVYYKNDKVGCFYYGTASKDLRAILQADLKKLNLKKINTDSEGNKITTYYEGKNFKYEKSEFVNSNGYQQTGLFVINKD
jgi:hypothetical protein